MFRIAPAGARDVAPGLIGTATSDMVVFDRYGAYACVDPEQGPVGWTDLIRTLMRISWCAGSPGCIPRRLLVLFYVLLRWHADSRTTAQQYAALTWRVSPDLQRGAGRAHWRRMANTSPDLL
jgi:transposase